MAENIIRQSQLITTYGPGAMIDLPDRSVIISGLQEWSLKGRERIHEPRLAAKVQKLLDANQIELWTPPRHDDRSLKTPTVGSRIFPTWFIVKDARPSPRNHKWRRRRLVKWEHLNRNRYHEEGKRKPVVPVRFVCGCRRGHINDLNWRGFIHHTGVPCKRPLWIEERGPGTDISDTYGVCDCGAERSLYEGSTPGVNALGYCEGKRPWIGPHARERCSEPYRLLVRTASNAYFPQTMSVISLPESKDELIDKISRHYTGLKPLADVGFLERFRSSPELAKAFDGYDDSEVIAAYHRKKREEQKVDVKVKTAEFEYLNQGDEMIGKDESDTRFHAQTLAGNEWVPEGNLHLDKVDKLVLVHRLREVVSLLGFTRFESIGPDKDGELDMEVARASLAETVDWVPAVENRGEGVFLSFLTGAVEEWMARGGVRQRGERLLKGWNEWCRERRIDRNGFPGLPYLMLHSLSHMLITSISLECGYPASSLRERIYAGESGYGILIYTGSPDAEGTLGGLVETGRRMADHLQQAIDAGRLCSNDPVCAEHAPDSQLEGRMLHGAACHGCLMIAETSCEQRNDFLDRALVVPTVAEKEAAFIQVAPT